VLAQIQVVHVTRLWLVNRTNKLQHGKKFVLASVDKRVSNAVFGKVRVIQLLPGATAWQRLFDSAPTAYKIVGMGAQFRYELNAVIHYGMNIPLDLQGTVELLTVRKKWCPVRSNF